MRYYFYRPGANNFYGIALPRERRGEIIHSVHYEDTPLAGVWTPPVCHGFDDNPPTHGDFPSLSSFNEIPVFSQRAWDALRPLIGYCCEALPIVYPTGEPYYIIHVMDTIDCVDVERSEVARFSDGEVMKVQRYALREELLEGKHIFKARYGRMRDLLVDEEFRQAVESHGLVGLKWVEIARVDEADP